MQISHAVLEELVTSYIVTLYYAAFLPFVFSGSILILLCCKLGYPIMHNYSENTTQSSKICLSIFLCTVLQEQQHGSSAGEQDEQ